MDDAALSTVDPALRDWLKNVLGESTLATASDPLVAASLSGKLAARDDVPVPVEALLAWHRLLIRTRLTLANCEIEFIKAARKEGWTWQRIADVLGLQSRQAAQQRLAVLAAEAKRTHPATSTIPWTGR